MPGTGGSMKSDAPRIAIAATFITALITAQLIAVKILAFPLPGRYPGVGNAIIVPAGVLAYALTFLASDCYAELYGRRPAQLLVNIGFGMNFVMLGLVWLAITAPGSNVGVDPAAFENVFGLATNIVIASLGAYVVSQNWDVIVFDEIGRLTNGQYLWLRNIASTGSSQLLDTVIFIGLAFSLVPLFLGLGAPLPTTVLVELIVGQYLVKLVIALLDTPIVYGVVKFVRERDPATRDPILT